MESEWNEIETMKSLQLPLKSKWFDMTKSGIKKEDYRDINHYWIKRLMTKKYDTIYPNEQEAIDGILKHIDPNFLVKNHSNKFKNNIVTKGYPKKDDPDRILILEHTGIEIREGNAEWGAVPGVKYFVIKHGKILTKNE
jgi:hypothetical protein